MCISDRKSSGESVQPCRTPDRCSIHSLRSLFMETRKSGWRRSESRRHSESLGTPRLKLSLIHI
eukprot:4931091-Alexandrium_andersonii.AAC.1